MECRANDYNKSIQFKKIGMTVESEGSVSGQEAIVILFYYFDKISHNSDGLKVESIILQSILDYLY